GKVRSGFPPGGCDGIRGNPRKSAQRFSARGLRWSKEATPGKVLSGFPPGGCDGIRGKPRKSAQQFSARGLRWNKEATPGKVLSGFPPGGCDRKTRLSLRLSGIAEGQS